MVECEVLDESPEFVAELKQRKSRAIDCIPKPEQVMAELLSNILGCQILPAQAGLQVQLPSVGK